MTTPFFSVITPTIQRESLVRCCKSVDAQTCDRWEHIVVADASQEDYVLWDMWQIRDQKRLLMRSPRPTRQWGNFQRHLAWEWATGEWVIFCDDDNRLADDHVLEDMAAVLQGIEEQWAIFPIMRHGRHFFHDPPGLCFTDTLNLCVRREVARWPNIAAREADGHFCDELKAKYPYKAFPDFRPIGVMEQSSNGV